MSVLETIQQAKFKGQKLSAILLDPDKVDLQELKTILAKIVAFKADFIFVGGSVVSLNKTQILVKILKQQSTLKVVLFPGDVSQISEQADALLFLSLLSGLNPEYLVTQHIKAAPKLKKTSLEIIPTAYVLVEGGTRSSVQKQSQTKPLSQNDISHIVSTALAGQFMGKQLIYLEAGSGAKIPVRPSVIKKVAKTLKIPLIVGGGIRTQEQLQAAFNSGADLVVIGTAFEENNLLLEAD
jgi:phosphoglycerol geranylgeranyltransferase